MPWRTSYIPFFEGVPFQIGFVQIKDQATIDFMEQYMVPNSKENNINGIQKVVIKGKFTDTDFIRLHELFEDKILKEEVALGKENTIKVQLSVSQTIEFRRDCVYEVVFFTDSNKGNIVEIENIKLHA